MKEVKRGGGGWRKILSCSNGTWEVERMGLQQNVLKMDKKLMPEAVQSLSPPCHHKVEEAP